MRKPSQRVFTVLLIAGLLTSSAAAQIKWLHPQLENGVSIEAFKSDFSPEMNPTALSSVLFINGQFRIASNLALLGDFPLASARYDFWTTTAPLGGIQNVRSYNGQTTFGNPYLGLEWSKKRNGLYGRVGFRPPVVSAADSVAWTYGVVTSFDRAEAFMPNTWTFSTEWGYRSGTDSPKIRLEAGAAPAFLVDHGLSTIVDFHLLIGPQARHLGLLTGFTGKIFLSSSDLGYPTTSYYEFNLAGNIRVDNVDFGPFVRIPMGHNWSALTNYSYGLSLAVSFAPLAPTPPDDWLH